MKKTISVNIKGLNFIIEEDAYQLLSTYLSRLEKNLSGQKGAQDIIEDIELRIAELCQNLISDKKQVLEKEDVQEIIRTLGNPEEFIEDDEKASNHASEENNSAYYEKYSGESYRSEKRLYRDIDNAKLAGICSGLANYLHVDVIIVRVIFLLFLFVGGFGVPLYIILWLVIPKTNSTIDRLRMQGKPITVDSVKDEIESAAHRFKNSSRSFADKVRNGNDYSKRFSNIGKIFRSAFGIGLLGTGIFFLIIFVVLFFGGLRFIPIVSNGNYLSVNQIGELLLSEQNDIILAWTGVLLVSFSVILFLVSNGTYLLMNLKSRWTKISSLSLFGFAVVGAIVSIFLSMKTAREVFTEAEIEKEISSINTSELIIEPIRKRNPLLGDYKTSFTRDRNYESIIQVKGNRIYDSGIEFLYLESKDSLYHIIQNLSANGNSYENATLKAKRIKHEISVSNNIVQIAPSFYFPKKDKIRTQRVIVIIEIPKNKSIRFGNEIINLEQKEQENDFDEDYSEKGGYMKISGEYESWEY